jgi:hypothetical protein
MMRIGFSFGLFPNTFHRIPALFSRIVLDEKNDEDDEEAQSVAIRVPRFQDFVQYVLFRIKDAGAAGVTTHVSIPHIRF